MVLLTILFLRGAYGSQHDVIIKLDAVVIGAITAQVSSDDIEIMASEIDASALSAAQMAALDGKTVPVLIAAHVFAGGDYISGFSGGVATVAVPFMIEDYDVENYKVYYVAEDGSLELVASEYVDGVFVFSTGHFSHYAVVYEPVEQESTFPMFSIVILVMSLAIMLVFREKR